MPSPALPEFSVGAMRIDGIDVRVVRAERHPDVEVRIFVRAPNLKSPERRMPGDGVSFVERIGEKHWNAMAPEYRAAFVRNLVLNAMQHELDEWLRMDGRLVTNAHPEEPDYAPDAILGGELWAP